MIKDAATADQKTPAPAANMIVVLNWLEELKARVARAMKLQISEFRFQTGFQIRVPIC